MALITIVPTVLVSLWSTGCDGKEPERAIASLTRGLICLKVNRPNLNYLKILYKGIYCCESAPNLFSWLSYFFPSDEFLVNTFQYATLHRHLCRRCRRYFCREQQFPHCSCTATYKTHSHDARTNADMYRQGDRYTDTLCKKPLAIPHRKIYNNGLYGNECVGLENVG